MIMMQQEDNVNEGQEKDDSDRNSRGEEEFRDSYNHQHEIISNDDDNDMMANVMLMSLTTTTPLDDDDADDDGEYDSSVTTSIADDTEEDSSDNNGAEQSKDALQNDDTDSSVATPPPQQEHTHPYNNKDYYVNQAIQDAAHLARMAVISSRLRDNKRRARNTWTPSSSSSRRHYQWEQTNLTALRASAAGGCLPLPATVHVQQRHSATVDLFLPGGGGTESSAAPMNQEEAAAEAECSIVLEDESNVSSLTGSHPHDTVVMSSNAHGSTGPDNRAERHVRIDEHDVEMQSGDGEISTVSKAVDSNRSSAHADTTSSAGIYTCTASADSKYASYACTVDSTQGDRSVEIHVASFRRPHMRAFHMAWISFFVAFFTWFALTPLLSEIQRSLSLSHEQIWTSSTYAVAGSAVTRILIGPINDKFGPRWSMSATLILSAIPTGLVGLVNKARGLNAIRLFIGIAGSTFVTCQYWTSCIFTFEVAGTANALAAGWGNLGGGITQIVMGSLLFPLFKVMYGGSGFSRSENDNESQFDRAADLSWRTICVFPAILCLVMAYYVMRASDDCPKGNYNKRSRQGLMQPVSAREVLGAGLRNRNTWVLFLQYGCCFGVEITMINAAALYFKEEFGQTTESAAAIASIFGWMNLFARGVGGFLSDMANARFGMRGRLWMHVIMFVMEGAMVIVFSYTQSLAAAIVVMIIFSMFVQAAEGSTFAIVPYVSPSATGSISGVVGSGGNVGGVVFSIIFREFDYRDAFSVMGIVAMLSALPTVLISFRGHRALLCGMDAEEVVERRSNHTKRHGNVPNIALGLEGDTSKRNSHLREVGSFKSESSGSRRSRLRPASVEIADASEAPSARDSSTLSR